MQLKHGMAKQIHSLNIGQQLLCESRLLLVHMPIN